MTLMSPATRQRRDVALLWGVSAGGRVLIVAGAGGVAGFVAAWFAPWQLSTLVGWDVAAALFLVWVGTTAGRFNTEDTHAFATREEGSTLVAGDLAESITAMKERHDEVHVIGSLDLVQSLLSFGLVDRLNLWLYPLLLGSGKQVFGGGTIPTALRLTESVTHPNGTLQLAYETAGTPTYGNLAD